MGGGLGTRLVILHKEELHVVHQYIFMYRSQPARPGFGMRLQSVLPDLTESHVALGLAM